jgi:hypothetical protein
MTGLDDAFQRLMQIKNFHTKTYSVLTRYCSRPFTLGLDTTA